MRRKLSPSFFIVLPSSVKSFYPVEIIQSVWVVSGPAGVCPQLSSHSMSAKAGCLQFFPPTLSLSKRYRSTSRWFRPLGYGSGLLGKSTHTVVEHLSQLAQLTTERFWRTLWEREGDIAFAGRHHFFQVSNSLLHDRIGFDIFPCHKLSLHVI